MLVVRTDLRYALAMTNLHAASMARYLARISCPETEALQSLRHDALNEIP